MQRILVVAPEPFYEDRGTPIALRHLVRALGELGFGVDILTFPVGRELSLPHVRYFRTPNPLGFKSIPIGFSLRKLFLDAFLARELLRRLAHGRYAGVHAVEEAAYFAVPLCRRAGVPVLYDMQSSIPEQLENHSLLGKSGMQRLERWIERWVVRRADLTVCSKGLGIKVATLAPEAAYEEWDYPSDVHDADAEEVAALRRELKIAPEMRVVTYCGNFEPYQGVPLVLRAIPIVARDIPDAIFVFVGAKDEAQRLQWERELDPAIRDRVRLVVRQPRERIPIYLALARVLVSPRIQGGNLPLKVFDYMASGRPIVATDIHTHRALLDDDTALLVQPEAEAIGKGILELLQNPVYAERLAAAARSAARGQGQWSEFVASVKGIFGRLLARRPGGVLTGEAIRSVSVVIPVRDSESSIGSLVREIKAQVPNPIRCDVWVVDDGSTDETARRAEEAGATVLRRERAERGNPAAARNLAASRASGDVLVFLDADCEPHPRWLEEIVAAHRRGERLVGGALDLPPGLPFWARVDYYAGWYHVHSARRAGYVPNHPPGNLSVRRALWRESQGFLETGPAAYAHEELGWQAELQQSGHRLFFEPRAAVDHRNRPGFGNLLARNYRWGYSAVESKASSGAARWSWVYRYPRALVFLAFPLVLAQTVYILGCWARARKWEAIVLAPGILAGRLAYGAGLAVGTSRWLARGQSGGPGERPRWE